jgi:hypothetical protein
VTATADRHPILALWAVPRSVSTAFERMMIERGDHVVFDEPFSRHYYFGPDKVSDRFDAVLPRSRVGEIVADLDRAAAGAPVFVKDMAYHAAAVASPELLGRMVNTFLIRDPASVLPSLARMWPDFTEEETGYGAVARLVELAEAAGQDPVIVDSDDLCREPARIVRAYCERVGIPFVADALSWEPGMRPEWSLWADWYAATARSTGFRPPPAAPPPRLDGAHLETAYDRCAPVYEELRARRLQ